MQIGHSMKLCISFCLVKFQVCLRFQQQNTISQLFKNPALNILGGGFVLCQIRNWLVSKRRSRQSYHLPSMLYDVKMNRLPVGFRIRINSSVQSSGLNSTLSHSATSLFNSRAQAVRCFQLRTCQCYTEDLSEQDPPTCLEFPSTNSCCLHIATRISSLTSDQSFGR